MNHNILYIYRAVSSVKLVYFLWENWKREPKPWQVLNQHPRCSTMQQNSRSVRIDDGDIWMTSMKAVKFHLQHHAIPWDLNYFIFFLGGGSHITLLKTKINLGKGWRPSEIWMLLKLFFQVLNIQISLAVPRFCLPGIPSHIRIPHLYMCHPNLRIFPHCQDSSNKHLRSTWSMGGWVRYYFENNGAYILIQLVHGWCDIYLLGYLKKMMQITNAHSMWVLTGQQLGAQILQSNSQRNPTKGSFMKCRISSTQGAHHTELCQVSNSKNIANGKMLKPTKKQMFLTWCPTQKKNNAQKLSQPSVNWYLHIQM